ncbi:MAG: pantetheine-phosphate adenylyltransferase [Bacillota bacterium]
MRKAICPGSFDPVTNGHIDIIERTARTFDQVVVAVLTNPRKSPLFSVEERLEMLREATAHVPNVVVESAHGLLVDFARSHGAQAIVKGLRPIQDFDYEWQMGMVNRDLDSEVETYFLMSRMEYSYLSSSIVRELASFGRLVGGLVPAGVERRLAAKFANE